MTIPRTTAKKLCTDVEYRLVNESFPPEVSQLSEKALAQRIKRARAARDKYRALGERQTREAKGRIAPRATRPSATNANTVTKQKIFDETLARFEKHAAPAEVKPAKRRTAAKASAKPARRSASRKSSLLPKIPALSKVVAKVSELVAERKAAIMENKDAPSKSGKTPANAGEDGHGGDLNRDAVPAPNPKGPSFPRNPHERGRLSSAFKQQQARRDSR